jgi:hypothetical protein
MWLHDAIVRARAERVVRKGRDVNVVIELCYDDPMRQ